MKYKYIIITLLLLACNNVRSNDNITDSFGDAITFEKTTKLSDIFSQKEANIGKEFKVEGTVTDVCQKKGCWMEIKDGDETVTVRFKEYSFFVPKDGTGRKATVQGVFTKETYEDTDDRGNTINKDYFQFIASGVELQKSLQK